MQIHGVKQGIMLKAEYSLRVEFIFPQQLPLKVKSLALSLRIMLVILLAKLPFAVLIRENKILNNFSTDVA
jgi:hypothetical protein